ncbi:MAG: hypothetical protein QOH74_1728 [Gaiellales bacterium]|nr:hypothetical protein [Gaiellales bacterium]
MLVVVAAVLVGAYIAVRGPQKAELTVRPQQAPLHEVVTKLNLAPGRTLLAGGAEGLWVARQVGTSSVGRLIKIDAPTMQRLRQWPLDLRPRGLAVGGGSVWVLGQPNGHNSLPALIRINPRNGRVLSHVVLAGPSACSSTKFTECDPVVIGGGVWVSLKEQLVKISLDGLRTERAVQFGGHVWDVAAAGGSLWALAERGLYKINPRNGDHTRIRLSDIGEGQQANHIAVGNDSLWISSFPTEQARLRIGRLTRVDITPDTPRIVKTFIYPGAGSLALLDGGLWIDRFSGQGELDRVNASDGVLTGPIVTNLDDVTRLVPLNGELWAVTWNPATRARQLVRVQLNPVTAGA